MRKQEDDSNRLDDGDHRAAEVEVRLPAQLGDEAGRGGREDLLVLLDLQERVVYLQAERRVVSDELIVDGFVPVRQILQRDDGLLAVACGKALKMRIDSGDRAECGLSNVRLRKFNQKISVQ